MTVNIAFIDGQNLHRGTLVDNRSVDFGKFRRFLKEKYHIEKAYYFLGYSQIENQGLYIHLQQSGFIVVFKKQSLLLETNKKGNIDSDLVFYSMKSLIDESENFDKIVLISGDGDFKLLVDYLIKKNRFQKILFPCKKYASSLYKSLGNYYFAYLHDVRNHIELK